VCGGVCKGVHAGVVARGKLVGAGRLALANSLDFHNNDPFLSFAVLLFCCCFSGM